MTLTLFKTWLWVLFLSLPLVVAADVAPEIRMPPDRELFPLMTQAEWAEFSGGQDLIRQGNANVSSGNALRARRPSVLNPNEDVSRDHREGDARIRTGEQQIARGQQMMNNVRQSVFRRYVAGIESGEIVIRQPEAQRPVPVPNVTAGLNVSNWQDFLAEEVPQILQKLWDAGYTRLVVLDSFFAPPLLEAGVDSEALDAAFMNALTRHDRNRSSLLPRAQTDIHWNEESSLIHFRRGTNSGPSAQVAYIIMEVAPIGGDNVIASLRGIDSLTLITRYAETSVLAEFPGLTPPAGGASLLPPTRISFFMENEFFALLSKRQQPIEFSIHANDVEIIQGGRLLLLRQYLFDQKNLKLLEDTTLARALEEGSFPALKEASAVLNVQFPRDETGRRERERLQISAFNRANEASMTIGSFSFD